MSTNLENERKLVEAAKQDSSRFAELYDKYFDAIYRYIYRRVSDQETVEDLVSQTFYDALSHLKSYQFRGFPFSSWLYKIAHNNVLKFYRNNSKYQKVDLEEIAELKDGNEDTTELAKSLEEKEYVQNALDKMEFEEREIVRLKYFEEVSNIEIAEIMGISANNVGVKLFRVLKKLKSLL